ncbi:MAG: DNA polymerase III [Treponema sp.]|jgi:DNA polymerase-3 subunit gamma/tau|nr:DNA polymerase III [Treponema sp.]
MFENILHQPITKQLAGELRRRCLARALLFSGPPASGKGTAALELARVLSCESETSYGSWNCDCPGCARHRGLVSQDLLLLGQKPFFAEINACACAFRREPESSGAKHLFLRSVRKLLGRFSPVLWEDDPRLGKLSALIAELEEDLEFFERQAEQGLEAAKSIEQVIKTSMKLEAGGMGESIPIAQIRKAAYWSRLAPAGIHKCVIIENADRMQEGAKNSLLKILEEPPERVTLILTCSRPGTLLPTILSRLRQYRFVRRNTEEETEVIRRIFRDRKYAVEPNRDTGAVSSYLDSFLPVDNRSLYSLGAFFVASIAASVLGPHRTDVSGITGALVELERFADSLAEAGGFGRPAPGTPAGGRPDRGSPPDTGTTLSTVHKGAENFEVPGVFSRFCKNILLLLSAFLRGGENSREKTEVALVWKRALGNAVIAEDTYNIRGTLVMERLSGQLKSALAERCAV